MFNDDNILINPTERILMVETPANQVQLPPPPPAREIEAPAMWHPTDRVDDQTERIPLANESEKDAANAVGIWLGMSALHSVVLDSRPERRVVPLNRLDVEQDEDEN